MDKPILTAGFAGIDTLAPANVPAEKIEKILRDRGLPQGVEIVIPQQYCHYNKMTIEGVPMDVISIVAFAKTTTGFCVERLTLSNLRNDYIEEFKANKAVYAPLAEFDTSCSTFQGKLVWNHTFTIKVKERKLVSLPEFVKLSGKISVKRIPYGPNGKETIMATVERTKDIYMLSDVQLKVPKEILDFLKDHNLSVL